MTMEKTWPNINNPDSDFVKIIREEEAFPYSEDVEYEIHLMVRDPASYIQQWISAGAVRIIVHIESFESTEKALAFVRNFHDQYGGDGSYLVTEIGMAINLKTPIESLTGIIEEVDFVQCMDIDDIGSQGQPFNVKVIDRVRELRILYPDLVLSVDGGITVETGQMLVDAGVDRLVVGSTIFNDRNPERVIETLENLV